MKEIHIKTNKTSRYFLSSEYQNTVRNVWLVCHGYGQLASNFIGNFRVLGKDRHLVVAPEGLSRFYLEGFSGKVGATWMTKECRESDIRDYVEFLDRLYEEIFNGIDRKHIKLHLLGFSQGAATATRWLSYGKGSVDTLVLWAGLFPKDAPFEMHHEKFKRSKIFLVHGNEDPFLEKEKVRQRIALAGDHGIPFEHITFPGKHEIRSEVLSDLVKNNPENFPEE